MTQTRAVYSDWWESPLGMRNADKPRADNLALRSSNLCPVLTLWKDKFNYLTHFGPLIQLQFTQSKCPSGLMSMGHFPPFCENLSKWQWDFFLLFVKTCQNHCGTFSSFLWKLVRMTKGHFPPFLNLVKMTVGHFPPFCEILSESLWDIFLLFVKFCKNVNGTFSSFLWSFARMSIGHFPPFCENLSEWQRDIFLLF